MLELLLWLFESVVACYLLLLAAARAISFPADCLSTTCVAVCRPAAIAAERVIIATTMRTSHLPQSTPCFHVYATAAAPPAATLATWPGFTFLPSLLYRTLGGGARLRRPSRERTLCRVSILLSFPCPIFILWARTGRSCREWRRRRSTAA